MSELSGLTKEQKKRQKRAAKSLLKRLENGKKEPEPVQDKDPLVILKEKLAEAKRLGDTELVTKLRQDVWVLQDTLAGHNPSLPQHELESSLNRIVTNTNSKSRTKNGEEDSTKSSVASSTLNPKEKQLRNLNKKLKQIKLLKTKLENGEKLEDTQIAKINTEAQIQEEINDITNELL
eukprot:gene17350-19083_t